jgi:hypothetical protein
MQSCSGLALHFVEVARHEFGSTVAAGDSIRGNVFRSFALKHVAEFADLA